ncbi:hypothetical protein [Lentzea sp. CC55]|uniref:hypothetical protein n=1 Tax=Lentzea sp. CC55 TaxID=2884909 RepID=UPI001F347FED|nr:hypothetical protein [Lentzea sp. CC55]MCG8926165.1 hypothetical protein [Lentzea sp. CC55]
MPRALLISIAGLGLIVLLSGIVWLYLRKKRKAEAGVALAAVALMVSATLPLLSKPVEDAWGPVTAPSGQTGTSSVAPSAVPPPDDAKKVLGAGWDPSREMFSINKPAPYVTLNSISDNPNIGDERWFYGVRKVDSNCNGPKPNIWQRHEKVDDGDYLRFRIYVENSAADSLDADGSHTAHGLRVRVILPSVIGDPTTGSAGQVESSAILTADNTIPKKYWYTLLLSSERSVRLEILAGTITLSSNHFKDDGLQLSDSFFYEPGMLLGYDKLDGNLRAGYQYALYMGFCAKATAART